MFDFLMFQSSENGRIQGRLRQACPARISELDEHGRVLQHSTQMGTSQTTTFLSPYGIAIDSRGDLYVADVMVTPEMEPAHQMVHKLVRARSVSEIGGESGPRRF